MNEREFLKSAAKGVGARAKASREAAAEGQPSCL